MGLPLLGGEGGVHVSTHMAMHLYLQVYVHFIPDGQRLLFSPLLIWKHWLALEISPSEVERA